MKRLFAIIILSVMTASLLACGTLEGSVLASGDIVTLYDSDTVKIEREDRETRIYDLEGNAQYSFQVKRIRQPKGTAEAVKTATVNVNTSTVKIETVHGLIIVTIKAEGKTIYVK